METLSIFTGCRKIALTFFVLLFSFVTIAQIPKGLKESAEKGNAEAQYRLGQCYMSGRIVKRDLTKGLGWYKKAAKQGNYIARRQLGYHYLSGTNVEDNKKGLELFKKLAERGDRYVQYQLGFCYLFGKGVKQDYKEAVNWFKKSAEGTSFTRLGYPYPLAELQLGNCYFYGYGVQKDLKKAVKWYEKSLKQRNGLAGCLLSSMGDLGIETNVDGLKILKEGRRWGLGYSEEEILWYQNDCREVVRAYEKTAITGDALAQLFLGYIYFSGGNGIQRDYNKSQQWLKQYLNNPKAKERSSAQSLLKTIQSLSANSYLNKKRTQPDKQVMIENHYEPKIKKVDYLLYDNNANSQSGRIKVLPDIPLITPIDSEEDKNYYKINSSISIINANPFSTNTWNTTIKPDAYGLGVHSNQFGQPIKLVPDFGGVPGERLRIKPNAYGPGVHMDQYGRPVREKPAFGK